MIADVKLDISVVICAYTEERWHDLVAAVLSIQQQSAPPYEIIVVIDHNPRLLERVQAHIPDVIVAENHEPRGLSGARNSGIALARSRLIAFLDDDAIAEPDWLLLLSRCCTDPQVLGAGGTVVPLWVSEKPAWFPEEFYWVVGCTYQSLPKTLTMVRNPFGGCTCIHREVFEIVGGFKHTIGRVGGRPMGGEETELSIRANQHWPQRFFLHEPQAKIHHRIPPYRAKWHYFRSRCYAEGLSKAVVTQCVGVKDSLASERSYTFQTLPRGIVRGVADGLFRSDVFGFLRAGAIIAGFMITMAGYLVGCISQILVLVKGIGTGTRHKLKWLLHLNNWNGNIDKESPEVR